PGIGSYLIEQPNRFFATICLERNARPRHLGGDGRGGASSFRKSREIVFGLVNLTRFELVECRDQLLGCVLQASLAAVLPEKIAAEAGQRQEQRSPDQPAIALSDDAQLILAKGCVDLTQKHFLLGGTPYGELIGAGLLG